jgi:hypothetical protein
MAWWPESTLIEWDMKQAMIRDRDDTSCNPRDRDIEGIDGLPGGKRGMNS